MNPPQTFDPAICPLCGGPNDCQLCTLAAHKCPCWCASLEIPSELLARVPEALRNRACAEALGEELVAQLRRERDRGPYLPVPAAAGVAGPVIRGGA